MSFHIMSYTLCVIVLEPDIVKRATVCNRFVELSMVLLVEPVCNSVSPIDVGIFCYHFFTVAEFFVNGCCSIANSPGNNRNNINKPSYISY